jgi:D-alanyl-D-alanine carboxypeptidase
MGDRGKMQNERASRCSKAPQRPLAATAWGSESMARSRSVCLSLVPLLAFAFHACAGGGNAPPTADARKADEHPDLARRVDAYLRPFIDNHLLRGAIAVEERGKIVVSRSYGTVDDGGSPFTLTTPSRIASITKTFTAAAIELLAQRQRLTYVDTLDKFLPQFPNASHISLQQLLRHEAGLADPDYASLANRHPTIDELVANIASTPPLFAPGTSGRYSNAGYVMLAKVIEVASGASYRDFLEHEIFQPLGLNETHVDRGIPPISGRAMGYVPGPPPLYATRAPLEQPEMFVGSGIVVASAHDLLTWAHAVIDGRLVDLGTLEYPYGWGVRKYLNDQVIEQSGEITGFCSYLAHYRQRGLTIAVLSNLEVGPNDRIGRALGQIAGGVAVEPPVFPKAGAHLAAPTVTGRFAGSNGEFALAAREGTLYARWNGASCDQYTSQIEPGVFFVPQDSSIIRIVDANTVERQWEGSPAVAFKRGAPP